MRAGLLTATAIFLAMAGPSLGAPMRDELQSLVSGHPLIKSGQAQVLSAEKSVKAQFGAFLPSLDANGGYGYERTESPSFANAPFSEWANNYGITLKQNVWDGGGRLAGYASAKIQQDIAEITLKNTRQTVIFEGIVAYLNVLRQRELVSLSSQNELNIRRQLNLEDERVRRGSGISVDVLQAKSRLQISLERLVAVTGALADAQSRYLQVFNKGAETDAMAAPPLAMSQLPTSIDEAINAALDENPTVLATNRQIDLAAERRESASADYQPSVDLVVLHKRESDFNATPGNRKDTTAKVQATWNLFNGLGTSNRTAAAAYDYEARQSDYAQTRRKTEEAVRLAWQAVRTNQERVGLLENAASIAAEVFDARNKLRESGKETAINVLDSENETFTARINLTAAQYDLQIAAYQLLQAMGRLELESVP